MGLLKALGTQRIQMLEPELLVGRASSCGLRIEERFVSARHAVVRWAVDRWEVKDLGSRNGTYLDGRRIRPGEVLAARRGAVIAFGKPELQWELVDDEPPRVMAVPLDDGEPLLLEGELLPIPSVDEPVATIYRNPDGLWVLEQLDEAIVPMRNAQLFEVQGRKYRFCSPDEPARTSIADFSPGLEVQNVELSFAVSHDEEHVELRASCEGRVFDLGARTHNYLLLTLARRRIDDRSRALPETSCGWIYQDELARGLDVNMAQLNLEVFRIRRQFAAIGLPDAAAIVERRPRTRQLRIGTAQLNVTRL